MQYKQGVIAVIWSDER